MYDGCDKKGDVHPGGATDDEIRRLAGADVVLATYDTLTRELASMNRTFDSHLERRQKLGLRTSNVGDEPRPSPLKFLSFWRVILDEVQKAPAGRKAGKVVRLLDAAHRWAVSGTPMDHGRADDLAQLLDFAIGHHSDAAAAWNAAAAARAEPARLAAWEREWGGRYAAAAEAPEPAAAADVDDDDAPLSDSWSCVGRDGGEEGALAPRGSVPPDAVGAQADEAARHDARTPPRRQRAAADPPAALPAADVRGARGAVPVAHPAAVGARRRGGALAAGADPPPRVCAAVPNAA